MANQHQFRSSRTYRHQIQGMRLRTRWPSSEFNMTASFRRGGVSRVAYPNAYRVAYPRATTSLIRNARAASRCIGFSLSQAAAHQSHVLPHACMHAWVVHYAQADGLTSAGLID